jgi:3-deoxy-D-manno-octulosonic-acid transferase
MEAGGGIRVRDEGELLAALEGLLKDPQKREQTGVKAKGFVEMNRGALKRVMDHLRVYLGNQ